MLAAVLEGTQMAMLSKRDFSSLDAQCQSLATVLHKIEGEESFDVFGPFQNLGMASPYR